MQRKPIATIAGLLLFAAAIPAQRGPAHPTNDQLGLTCAQILAMPSTDWVAKFRAVKGSEASITIRAIAAYGKCYDARTDQLASSLGRSGKGPLMGARGDFQDLEKSIKVFEVKALVDSQPPADPVKKAYATLYEKQFRYEFYESYQPKPAAAPPGKPEEGANPPQRSSSTSTSISNSSVPQNANAVSAVDAAAAAEVKAAKDKADQQKSDADPVTQAKNHFGALLGDLPEAQVHELHSAFGEILGPNAASPRMQLLVYRYAIFLLEPPGEPPFAPPPF